MSDDTPNYWGTTSTMHSEQLTLARVRETMAHLRETLESFPAPYVLMVAPVPRGTMYAEKKPGALLKMKERVRVVLVHKDDVQAVQSMCTAAGQPPFRIVTSEDMAPPELPPLKTPTLPDPDSGFRMPFLYFSHGWRR